MENFEQLLSEFEEENGKVNLIGSFHKASFSQDKRYRKYLFRTERREGFFDILNLYIPAENTQNLDFVVGETYDVKGKLCTFNVKNSSLDHIVAVVCDKEDIKKVEEVPSYNTVEVKGVLVGDPMVEYNDDIILLKGLVEFESCLGRKNQVVYEVTGNRAEYISKKAEDKSYVRFFGHLQSKPVIGKDNQKEYAHKIKVSSFELIK